MNLTRKRRPLLSSRGPRRVAAEERGAEIVEFAIVLAALLMLLIGIIWMGRAYNIYQTMTRAAREGARYAAAPTCALCATKNTLPDCTSQVKPVVDAALTAAALDTSNTKYKATFNCQNGVTLNPGAVPPETGVVVSFGYDVNLVIPFTTLNASTLTLATQVQMRQEQQ